MEIYPSLISADLLNLETVIKSLEPFVDGYHIDVMDNHFVPNLTWGPVFVNAISKIAKKPLGVHLMVDKPGAYLDKLVLREHDFFIFHYESRTKSIHDLIKMVRSKNIKVGLAINPKTPVDSVFDYLNLIDQLLVMSVEPGSSGQAFIPEAMNKMELLVKFKKGNNLPFIICMDGGINEQNIKRLHESDLDGVAIASAIFSKQDPVEEIKSLRKLIS